MKSTRHPILLGTLLTLSIGLPIQASSASFDCKKASTAIEKTICGDDVLGRYDQRMAYAYQQLQQHDKKNAGKHKAAQQDWLRQRGSQCGNGSAACLLKLYAERTSTLEMELAAVALPKGNCESVYEYQHVVGVDPQGTLDIGTDVLISAMLDKNHVVFELNTLGNNGHTCSFAGVANVTPTGFRWATFLPDVVSDANSPECELEFTLWQNSKALSLQALRGNDADDPVHGATCQQYFCGMRAGLPPADAVFARECDAVRK